MKMKLKSRNPEEENGILNIHFGFGDDELSDDEFKNEDLWLDEEIEIDAGEEEIEDAKETLADPDADREDSLSALETLNGLLFERYGYSFIKAEIIRDKIGSLYLSQELDYSYVRKLLKEFDLISCCLADLKVYPQLLIESLFLWDHLMRHDNISTALFDDILYILSIYQCFPFYDSARFVLEDENYNCSKSGFLSFDERMKMVQDKYDDFCEDEEINYYEEIDEKLEIYGCSVLVRFPNQKEYKYNCRFHGICEEDVVKVKGKMRKYKGVVVKRFERWDLSSLMEEIDLIEEEE